MHLGWTLRCAWVAVAFAKPDPVGPSFRDHRLSLGAKRLLGENRSWAIPQIQIVRNPTWVFGVVSCQVCLPVPFERIVQGTGRHLALNDTKPEFLEISNCGVDSVWLVPAHDGKRNVKPMLKPSAEVALHVLLYPVACNDRDFLSHMWHLEGFSPECVLVCWTNVSSLEKHLLQVLHL